MDIITAMIINTMTVVAMGTKPEQAVHGLWYGAAACALSLFLASSLSLLVLLYPAFFAGEHSVSHGVLSLMMFGISAGFVHGVGFIPRFWLWKILFGPQIGWLLMVGGLLWLLLR